jgi:hypothetical protein
MCKYAISRFPGKRECRTAWTLHSDGRHKRANMLEALQALCSWSEDCKEIGYSERIRRNGSASGSFSTKEAQQWQRKNNIPRAKFGATISSSAIDHSKANRQKSCFHMTSALYTLSHSIPLRHVIRLRPRLGAASLYDRHTPLAFAAST